MYTTFNSLSLVPGTHSQRDPDWPYLGAGSSLKPITEARKIGSSDWSGLVVGVVAEPGLFGGRLLGFHARTRSLLSVNFNRQRPWKITLPAPRTAGGHRRAG